MVGESPSHATARRAAIDAVPASWTIGSEKDGCALYRISVTCESPRSAVPCGCGPACAGRASPRLSPAREPGRGAAGAALILTKG
jgi:hypothetical protein